MVGDPLTPGVGDQPRRRREESADEADVVRPPRSTPDASCPVADYAVFWLDLNGRVTRWSDEARELFGHASDEASGLRLHDLFVAEDRETGVPDRALELTREGGSWDGVGWRSRRDGESFWAATSLTVVRTPNGLDIGVMAVTRKLDAALTPHRGGPDANRLVSLGRVASEVSHDVRNILSAIRGFACLLEQKLPPEGGSHQLWHELVKACDRGADLTERVLGVARPEAEPSSAVCLAEAVRALHPMLRQIVPARIEVELDLDEGVAAVAAQRHDIELAVLNVVVNARDAIRGPGRIRIALTSETGSSHDGSERVVLSVTDSGTGMSPEIQDRIFERFFTTKRVGEGTGLGMAVVRDAVREAGGSIEIESTQGAGTVVRLVFEPFPMKEDVDVSGREPRTRPPDHLESRPEVLICCESPLLAASTAELLARRGLRARVATNEVAARRALADRRSRFSAILLEATDSVVDDDLERLLRHRLGPDVPLVTLVPGDVTGASHAEGREAGREGTGSAIREMSGAARTFRLPVDPNVLCQAVLDLATRERRERRSVH